MCSSRKTGKLGEDLAATYLEKQGYTILERNWYHQHQEIDILATKDSELIVIEVKCRSGNPLTDPHISVNKNKQRLLIKAANAYIQKKDLDMEVRFDIISVLTDQYIRIEHIENAFYPYAGNQNIPYQ